MTSTLTCSLGFEHPCAPCAVCSQPVLMKPRQRPTATVLCDDVCRAYHRRKQQRDWWRAKAAAKRAAKRKPRVKPKA